MAQMTVSVKGLDNIVKQLNKEAKKAEKVISYTISDMRTRIPAPVAKEVTKVYNIAKKEVQPAKKGKDGKWTKSAVRMEVKGKTIDDAVIKYIGRPLSMVNRFDVSPTTPPNVRSAKRKAIPGKYLKMKKIGKGPTGGQVGMAFVPSPYPVSAMILKGRRENLENAFIAFRKGGNNYEPFKRKRKLGQPRGAIEPWRTVSVPQMITAKKVRPNIDKQVADILEKRLTHNIKRIMK